MVVRKKKYQSGEASNFVTRKQALHKLQLNLKVSKVYGKKVMYQITKLYLVNNVSENTP